MNSINTEETDIEKRPFTKRLSRFFKKICMVLFVKKYRECFILYNKALIQSLRGNYDEAIKNYYLILQKDVMSDYLIYKDLGIVYSWSGRFNESEAALRKSLELCMKAKKRDGELYDYLGRVSLKQGKFKDALFFYERAAQLGKERKLNRLLTDLEHIEKIKNALESHKEEFPFLTAYYKQNKHKFVEKQQ